MATILGLGWLATLLYIDAIVSPADTGLIDTTVTARLSYAAARNGNAPTSLGRTNRHGVPWVGLLVAFVVGLIIFLPFPSWQQLVGFITSATVLSFATGPLSLAAMRRQLPDRTRPFRLPGGDVVAFLAFYSSNLIVYWAGWNIDWKLFVAVLLGFLVLGIFHLTGHLHVPMEWRAGATWILPWLAGLAVISWLGVYGGGRGLLGFGVAFPVVGVFSLVIFLLAVKVRLGTATVAEPVEASRAEAAHEEEELERAPA